MSSFIGYIKKFFTRNINNRIVELDILRFVAILLMTFSHLTYAMMYYTYMWDGFASINPAYFSFLKWGYYWFRQNNIFIYVPCSILFLTVSGITTSFSKAPLSKSFKFTIIALLVTILSTLASLALSSNLYILFGIIHLHALAMWIYTAIFYLCKNRPHLKNAVAAVVGFACLIVGLLMNNFHLRPNASNSIFFMFGFFDSSFSSQDYYPLFPWGGVFLLATVLGSYLYRQKKSLFPSLSRVKLFRPLNYLAAYSLEYYFAHPVVIFLILGIIGILSGFPL